MKVWVLCIQTVLLFISCLIPEEDMVDSLSVMTWNVQNLFDDQSSGVEYEEYDPQLSDWDENSMRIKLENLKEVLLSAEPELPDIILLQEVENREILEVLNEDYLDGYYSFIDAWDDRESAICCGILSCYTPEEVHLHFPGLYGKRQLRPVVEIHFRMGSETLILFNNHWKSRAGGQAATETARIRAAGVLSKRIVELRNQGYTNLVVAGDLNGSWEDFRAGGVQTAQIPVEEIQNVSWTDCLYISLEPADTFLSTDKTVLYSPWKGMESEGSYFFQNRWMKLDHFFLDRGLVDQQGLEYLHSSCMALPFMSDELGRPAGWESWRLKGYSDHFPLILFLGSESNE
ncbi:endonuclease/exonuclease/phosphatase family protein [Oceanispirochaeta crateris]|uniref:Endonuclease/exonuclease/phosphatase family protein n=1 Tax=Oceanispirochaeta crateris TaxID=2518645 RepID=A0A5C1QNH8_9SPIO|nr:endonuclease/exonuclease/phosphatase family protein [Oceanispirochaeta crateris]QEN08898.1 endonuclease/exonuclease/phosphatase family protein [Oceanispirochaeta crateris]